MKNFKEHLNITKTVVVRKSLIINNFPNLKDLKSTPDIGNVPYEAWAVLKTVDRVVLLVIDLSRANSTTYFPNPHIKLS